MGLQKEEIKNFLDEMSEKYNRPEFIERDPISIPHMFSGKEDIEISGFLVAAIAWGRRDLILRSAGAMIDRMDNAPYDFIMSAKYSDLEKFSGFVHRTFNGTDCIFFLRSLRNLYSHYGSMEDIIIDGKVGEDGLKEVLSHLRNVFFSIEHPLRTKKHFADLMGGAAGKRLNMFLRWMVRKDNRGVDFGIWKRIDPAELYIPLDLHSGNIARRLGLLTRKINDWKAVEELTGILRQFDPADPVKYDFALFGFGVNEKL
jgi:uncharacterized protein (TIGR02757 family)